MRPSRLLQALSVFVCSGVSGPQLTRLLWLEEASSGLGGYRTLWDARWEGTGRSKSAYHLPVPGRIAQHISQPLELLAGVGHAGCLLVAAVVQIGVEDYNSPCPAGTRQLLRIEGT